MPVRAVLFDLYETLVWSDQQMLDAGRAALAQRAGVEPREFIEQMGRTEDARFRGALGGLEAQLAEVLRACGTAPAPELLHELAALERATWARGVHLYDDTLTQLRALRRAGRRLALVSNCAAQTAARVAELGLDREVDCVVLSCDVGVLKPEPGIFVIALGRLGVPAHDGIFIDDRPQHLDAARTLGLRTVLIERGTARPPANPRHTRITALAELRPLLQAEP